MLTIKSGEDFNVTPLNDDHKKEAAPKSEQQHKRPRILSAKSFKIQTPYSDGYVNVSFRRGIPVEVFFNTLNPEHLQWSSGLMLAISYAMRYGEIHELLLRLRCIHDPKGGHHRPGTGEFFPSIIAEIAEILQKSYNQKSEFKETSHQLCPMCSTMLTKVAGCKECTLCNYNACD